MAEQKLNLFQFTSRGMAQPGAGPAKVVRGKFGKADCSCRLFYDVPNRFLRHAVPPYPPNFVNPAEHPPSINTGHGEPLIQLPFDPTWHRNCPDMAGLADQIDDGPMLFTLL